MDGLVLTDFGRRVRSQFCTPQLQLLGDDASGPWVVPVMQRGIGGVAARAHSTVLCVRHTLARRQRAASRRPTAPRLRQQHELPELKAGDELRFTLDLSGKGSLSVRINRGPPQVLSGSRGLVPGRGLAKDRVREVYARAHIWDGAMVKARSRMPRTERRALGPHCAVTFLPSQAE